MGEHGLLTEKDPGRDTYDVDVERLNDSLGDLRRSPDVVFFDSHLAHMCDCSRIIVLRCRPDVLAERLRGRGYPEEKVIENVQAEVLDVILCEAADTDIPVAEIDCTAADPRETVGLISRFAAGEDICPPGGTDWSQGMDKWF